LPKPRALPQPQPYNVNLQLSRQIAPEFPVKRPLSNMIMRLVLLSSAAAVLLLARSGQSFVLNRNVRAASAHRLGVASSSSETDTTVNDYSVAAFETKRLLSKNMEELLNAKAAQELKASAVYLQASYFFKSLDLEGFSSYLKAESEDERSHGLQMLDFVIKRAGKALVLEVPSMEPQFEEWNSPTAVFETLVNYELEISKSIDACLRAAQEEDDASTEEFMNAFVIAQVDEVYKKRALLRKVSAYSELPGMIFLLDRELGGQAA